MTPDDYVSVREIIGRANKRSIEYRVRIALEDYFNDWRGTCKLEQHGSLADWPDMVCWSCSECGFGWHHSRNDKQFSFCPNCGRKVEQ